MVSGVGKHTFLSFVLSAGRKQSKTMNHDYVIIGSPSKIHMRHSP